MSRQRTAFVLAGGGSLGAIEVGMLHALVAHGVRPDLVVGSSAGAINAAYFAARPDLEGVRGLADIWRRVRRDHVSPVTLLSGLRALVFGGAHLADPGPLRHLLEQRMPYGRLEETAIPCVIVATDLMSGREVALSSGAVVDVLLASSALPAVFPPVLLSGRRLVDGMLASHTPITSAITAGASRIGELMARRGGDEGVARPWRTRIASGAGIAPAPFSLMTVFRPAGRTQ